MVRSKIRIKLVQFRGCGENVTARMGVDRNWWLIRLIKVCGGGLMGVRDSCKNPMTFPYSGSVYRSYR